LNNFIKIITLNRKTCLIFTLLWQIVGFIKNDDWILKINIEILSILFVNQVIVWHEDYICSLCSVFHQVVGTCKTFFSNPMQLFNIIRIPGKCFRILLSSFQISARHIWSLHFPASWIKSSALVYIYCTVYAQMISWSN